ncbi:MAG: redoxin domain-containing protein, partial [Candidatus Riflebacteria bacterium]|nr:redoxin domain-containing protein [Candidatus Riflebacteria bacterium]
MESATPEFERRSATVLTIAAQRRGGLFSPESYWKKHPHSFPILLDEDRAVSKTFGVYQRIGWDAYDIARPASIVVDAAGIIRFLYVSDGQTDRPPMRDLLEALDRAAESRTLPAEKGSPGGKSRGKSRG